MSLHADPDADNDGGGGDGCSGNDSVTALLRTTISRFSSLVYSLSE